MFVNNVSRRTCWLWSCLIIPITKTSELQRPNVVFIVADDLGWDDVSFHGSDQIMTPNIDLLAYSGVALQHYYTHSQCSPSRAAMLTGKYAHRLGLQGYPILESEDRGVPLSEKLLPQYMKELDYATHLVGKWHLGQSRRAFLPTSRGFDTHFGHRGGFIDYYEYIAEEDWVSGTVSGFNLYRNLTAAWDVEGYITDVYTDEAIKVIKSHDKAKLLFLMVSHLAPHAGNDGAPLQAPPEVVRSMRHVEISERRIYAAMIKKLDDSVGRIMATLEELELINNTVVVFVSDNGGMTRGVAKNWALNWPLRGLKMSPFEGGTRVVGLVWSKAMNFTSNVCKGRMHSVDWLPTLIKIASGDNVNDIDGVNLWDSITSCRESVRTEHIEIDDYTGYLSITSGQYKLISGEPIAGHSQDKYGDEFRNIIKDRLPSYEEVLRNSIVYGVLEKIGKPLDMQLTLQKRKKLVVDCKNYTKQYVLCQPNKDKLCLFDIEDDPCERNDLSKTLPEVTQRLYKRVMEEWDKRVPRIVPMFRDPESRPCLHNYTWTYWKDIENIQMIEC